MPLTPVYAREDPPEEYSASIFAAGPTPRSPEVPSWRPELLALLETAGFDGVVFIPEPRDGIFAEDYTTQVAWEERHLSRADVILFWIPRSASLPGFTTNVEWGAWASSGRVVLGAPESAERMRYLSYYAEKLGIPLSSSLPDTVSSALSLLGDTALRRGGERSVPLSLWRSPAFSSWYASHCSAGSTLLDARVLWTFPPASPTPFATALHPDLAVPGEERVKDNEFVLLRPDTVAVLLHSSHPDPWEREIVLVEEFRSAVRNPLKRVRELPGGSGEGSPLEVALTEVREEVGLSLAPSRLARTTSAQPLPTLSTHTTTLFTAELTPAELDEVRSTPHAGNASDSEHTFPLVLSLRSALADPAVDWSTRGMLATLLA